MKRTVVLLALMLLCCLTVGSAQSLEEMVEGATPGDLDVIEVRQDERAENRRVSEGFAESVLPSPSGMLSFERLFTFVKSLMAELFGEDYDENSGTETAGAGSEDEDMPGDVDNSEQPKEPEDTKPLSGYEAIPIRAGAAGSGSEFMQRTEKMTPAQREEAILAEILAGNIPSFLREFKEIEVSRKLKDGKVHVIKYKVMPDVLAIGSDSDFVRMPMSPLAAQTIADKFACILPTTQMSDDIYSHAETKLTPSPMSGGQYKNWQQRMTKNEFYTEHQRLVEEKCRKAGHQNGMLIAGHKKDVIITNFLNSHKDNVVIYGWHDSRNGGKPIQGYGWGHEVTYADYSHGIRLIANEVEVDGEKMDIKDVLADPTLSKLLSKEGPVKNTRAHRK
ncbi:MAG: hypothetical protein CVV42_12080 [Candidatus Riflebacteria bacterium HGW-Riflebacteria-2]|jgi:hypothetical protein|nr:MAG: hypothetical protein CVV42_12080 [Candidatus Riflebacteria bacterium HGW-Riflebacteria-2]